MVFPILEKPRLLRSAVTDELVKELDEEIARKATEKPVVGQ